MHYLTIVWRKGGAEKRKSITFKGKGRERTREGSDPPVTRRGETNDYTQQQPDWEKTKSKICQKEVSTEALGKERVGKKAKKGTKSTTRKRLVTKKQGEALQRVGHPKKRRARVWGDRDRTTQKKARKTGHGGKKGSTKDWESKVPKKAEVGRANKL